MVERAQQGIGVVGRLRGSGLSLTERDKQNKTHKVEWKVLQRDIRTCLLERLTSSGGVQPGEAHKVYTHMYIL